MINILIDIEATGRTHESVFAVAIYVRAKKYNYSEVFYFPDNEDKRSENTMNWWMSNEKRKEFFEKSMLKCKENDKKTQIYKIRKFIDNIYKENEEIIFYSDFPVFDIGLVNSLLAEYDLLPLYLKDDSSAPSKVVNYNNYIKGVAKLYPYESSKKAYEVIDLIRVKREESHDPLKDVESMMNEVDMILEKVKLLNYFK